MRKLPFIILFAFGNVLLAQEKPIFLNRKLLDAETLEPINDKFYRSATVKDNGLIVAQENTAWT